MIETEKVKIRFEAEFLEGNWAVNVEVPVEGREDCVGALMQECCNLARHQIVDAGGGATLKPNAQKVLAGISIEGAAAPRQTVMDAAVPHNEEKVKW